MLRPAVEVLERYLGMNRAYRSAVFQEVQYLQLRVAM